MIKDGKAYFVNPWYNREVQMPEFAGVEWGPGLNPFINEEERDQIAAALLRYHNRKLAEEKATFEEAMARQKRIADEGELERLAAIARRVQRDVEPPPLPEVTPTRPTTQPEPQRATTAPRTGVVRAQAVSRGQPIRVTVAGPINLRRITARIVR